MLYTEEEKLRVIQYYYANQGNVSRARHQYMNEHPGPRIPSRKTIGSIVRNHAERKSLKRKKREPTANFDEELDVLLHFEGKLISFSVNIVIHINFVVFMIFR